MQSLRRIVTSIALFVALCGPAGAQSAQFTAGQIFGNSTAGQRNGRPESVTAILDRAMSSTRGVILERGAGGWAAVGPGATSGLPWVSNGAGADPAYQALPISGTGISGFGTGVVTALGTNVGTAGAVIVNGGVLGTPSSGVATNLTGLPISTGITGVGTGVLAALANNVGSAGAFVTNGGALGSPSSVGTMPAFTLGGTISGAGNQLNNIIIGSVTPLAANFTTVGSGADTITSTSANALAVGPSGTTNPTFSVDANTASAATGFNIKSAAAAGGVALSAISSGTNENLTFNAKGSGTIGIGNVSTGIVTITPATVFGSSVSSGPHAITSSSATAFSAGLNGATNPAFNIDANTASSATGINIKSAAAAGGVALSTISSGTNEAMTINAKGSGTITLGSVSTGGITASTAFTSSTSTTTPVHIANGTVPVGTTGSCVASSFTGGATAGKFSAAVCTAGTIILSSMPAAPNGYTCNAQDQTTSGDTLKQTANTTTSVTFTATTVAADVIAYQCTAW